MIVGVYGRIIFKNVLESSFQRKLGPGDLQEEGKRGLFKLTRLNTGSRIKHIETRGMVPNYNSCLDKEMTVCHRDQRDANYCITF